MQMRIQNGSATYQRNCALDTLFTFSSVHCVPLPRFAPSVHTLNSLHTACVCTLVQCAQAVCTGVCVHIGAVCTLADDWTLL